MKFSKRVLREAADLLACYASQPGWWPQLTSDMAGKWTPQARELASVACVEVGALFSDNPLSWREYYAEAEARLRTKGDRVNPGKRVMRETADLLACCASQPGRWEFSVTEAPGGWSDTARREAGAAREDVSSRMDPSGLDWREHYAEAEAHIRAALDLCESDPPEVSLFKMLESAK